MTSNERKEARYQRRKAKREAKAREVGGKTFDEVFSFGNLISAGRKACNGVRWKTSTILFETFLLQESLKTKNELKTGRRKFKGFRSFRIVEHGKERAIDALAIRDRAAQKCLCQNLLTEALSRGFVTDNAASMKYKGMDYSLQRLKKHLQDHFRKHGLEGGIYQFDFKDYFGSIPHQGTKQRQKKRIFDSHIYRIFCWWVDDFMLLQTADMKKKGRCGVGLGSETSQIISLDYASPIDHLIKDVLSIHGYGRYMDDGYIISDSLEELYEIKRKVYALAESIGLRMSDKKNIITPFKNHGFTFLKMKTCLTKTGKVIMKLGKKSIRSIRRKVKIFRRWVSCRTISAEDVFCSYQSWRAHARRVGSFDTLQAADEFFARLFPKELQKRKRRFPCTLIAVRKEDGWHYFRRNAGRKETRWNTSATTISMA